MGAPHLKAVPPVPEPVTDGDSVADKTVAGAAGRSYRDLLVALRGNIADQIDAGVQPRDLAALSRRLLEISKEIADIEAGENGDEVGEAAVTPDEKWTPTPS